MLTNLSAIVSLCCSLIINQKRESLLARYLLSSVSCDFLIIFHFFLIISNSPKQVDFLAGQSLLSRWMGVQASHPLTKSILLKGRKNGQQKTCNLSCNIAAKPVE